MRKIRINTHSLCEAMHAHLFDMEIPEWLWLWSAYCWQKNRLISLSDYRKADETRLNTVKPG